MCFEVLDISEDAGIRAYGSSIEELFASAAMGMYSFITDIEKINEKHEIDIEASGASPEGLLVAYLNELVFNFDAYGFIGKRVNILNLKANSSDCSLRAKIYGEEFDEDRHERHLLIKAATYHNLRLEKTADGWTAEVVFDI
jgi:SHS2 domain-containing protein